MQEKEEPLSFKVKNYVPLLKMEVCCEKSLLKLDLKSRETIDKQLRTKGLYCLILPYVLLIAIFS